MPQVCRYESGTLAEHKSAAKASLIWDDLPKLRLDLKLGLAREHHDHLAPIIPIGLTQLHEHIHTRDSAAAALGSA